MSGRALAPGARPDGLGRAARAGVGGPARARGARIAPSPLRVPDRPSYAKRDVFEVCAALAEGEALLRLGGHEDAAGRLATAFDVVEAGLAR